MDFFQAQDNAHRRTRLLVFYYLAAVALIVVAVYLAVTAGFIAFEQMAYPEGTTPVWPARFWDPQRFIIAAGCTALLIGLGSLVKVASLRSGGAAVAQTLGGDRVDRSTREPRKRQLLNVVEEMAIASGVPVPEVYILSGESSINAFAAGWGTDDAVIAVSAGALNQLNRDELQGVIAHEYSHVLHGDCRLNIRLMGILFGIMMLTVFAQLLRVVLRGGGRGGRVVVRGGGRGGKGGGGAVILAVLLVIVLVTVIGYIGTVFARLIQAAISRQREFLADAAAVQFTRNPSGIAGALKKVAIVPDHSVIQHPRAAEAAHMFFADGLRRSFSSVFATHPPLDVRIRRIQPDWDGRFDDVRRKPVPVAARAQPAAPAARTAAPAGKEFIHGMAVLAAVGTLSRENLATARSITAALPADLDERMRHAEGARQVLTALVMADNPLDDAAQWKVLEAALSPDDLATTRAVYAEVAKLPRQVRLGALELATTTLAQAPAGGQDDFLTLLNNLIQIDDRLSLYEFCLRRILRERLARGDRTAPADNHIQYTELKPAVAAAAGNLLSIVAREVSGAGQPADLMAAAVRGQYLLNAKVAYEESAGGAMERLDRSLNVLRASAYAIRAQCLRAVVHCIKADGQLTPQEAEILRMLSLSLDCPLPPLDL